MNKQATKAQRPADEGAVQVIRLHSGRHWKAIPNSSWGAAHKGNFGDRSGYVICYTNKHDESVALAAVIGQPFVKQTEIDANARLIEMAPDMARLINRLAKLDEGQPEDIGNVISAARELSNRLVLERAT